MALNMDDEHLSLRDALLFGLMGIGLLVFQTTVIAWVDPWGIGPDLCMILVIYSGLHLPITSGSTLVVGWGLLKDAAGGSILGFYAAIFLLIFLIANLTRQKLDPAAPWYQVLFIFLFVMTGGTLTLAALSFFDRPFDILPTSITSPAAIFLVSAIFTSLVGPLVFWVIKKLFPMSLKVSETES
ncbi:MAG: rod shape-determining protein MreD [Deltaproteobacteria bacterium]|nr:rod shape-determining protein MreD [Deltaproteobacteria bacterium]